MIIKKTSHQLLYLCLPHYWSRQSSWCQFSIRSFQRNSIKKTWFGLWFNFHCNMFFFSSHIYFSCDTDVLQVMGVNLGQERGGCVLPFGCFFWQALYVQLSALQLPSNSKNRLFPVLFIISCCHILLNIPELLSAKRT